MDETPRKPNKTPDKAHKRAGETPFAARVRKELDRLYGVWKVKLWRNNTGRLQDRFGNWVTFGLCVGSSDNIGYRSIIITPEMVNKHIAVFVAAEAKTAGKTGTEAQEVFLQTVRDAGGIGVIWDARDGELTAMQQITEWKP